MSQNGDWWKKINNLYPRSPEAFKTDGGAIWTTGEKGNIFKDEFFYVPKDFSWLGNGFKGIKSLVSGIGLKITDIVGEKFNSKMDGINFGERRNQVAEKNAKLGNDVFTRKVSFERVAYYKPDGAKAWELGDGVCVIRNKLEGNGKGQHVYLFVGFAEVEVSKGQWHKSQWNFKKDNFFQGSDGCEILKKSGWNNFRLVSEKIGRNGTKDQVEGNKVIVLGTTSGGARGIATFRTDVGSKPLIGMLMGVAVNLAQHSDCDGAFRESDDSSAIGGRAQGIKKCLETAKGKVEKDGDKSLNVEKKDSGDENINEGWVKEALKDHSGNKYETYKLNSWHDSTELPYQYK